MLHTVLPTYCLIHTVLAGFLKVVVFYISSENHRAFDTEQPYFYFSFSATSRKAFCSFEKILTMNFAGNSCRSPMAESVLKSIAEDDKNLFVDSAAIADWNVGYSPEPRCIQVLSEHNMTSEHITRQVQAI